MSEALLYLIVLTDLPFTEISYQRSLFAVMMMKSYPLLSALPHSTAYIFTLPEILPEQTQLHLYMDTRIALLLHLYQEEPAPQVHVCQLTPSTLKIFLALLQASPQHCSYQTLFAALYPATQEAASSAYDPAWSIRPIRRALGLLTPVLRTFGLEVVALRGRGYVLAPAAPLAGTSL